MRLREDFGYDVPEILDLVLDPDSHGVATGTSFDIQRTTPILTRNYGIA